MPQRFLSATLSKAKRRLTQGRRFFAKLLAKKTTTGTGDQWKKPYGSQDDCLLFKLPPELRAQIGELVFATPSRVNLVDAQAPGGKELTATCQWMYGETAEMYTHMYRSYWSDTNFFIDVFEGDRDAGVRKPGEVIVRTLDGGKQHRIYAKVKELRDEDVLRIEHVHIYLDKSSCSYVLGDPHPDMWSYWFPTPEHLDHRAIYLYVPTTKRARLESEGLKTVEVCWTKMYVHCIVQCWKWVDVQRARKIIDRKGLSKEELMSGIRFACQDRSQAAWAQ